MATPALRIRIAPKFPAKLQAGVGLGVSRAGGVVTYRQDWSAVQDLVTPPDQAEVLIRDPDDNQLYRSGLSGLGDFIRPVASQDEAEAGSNNTKTMTPLRAAQAVSANVFPTRDALLTRSLPAAQVSVQTSGYSTPGIGAARYVAVGSEPSHLGKFQTLDGRWWEISEPNIDVRMFGAKGDGAANDTVPVANAINYAQAKTHTVNFGPGSYLLDSFPEINSSLTIRGANPQTTQLMFSGTSDSILIQGSDTRASAVRFQDITLNGNSKTGGYLVKIDWAQNITFDNVYFNNPWNGVYGRQVGNLEFTSCLMTVVRGEVGVDLFSNNTARNGENDQTDLVVFKKTIIQSDLPAVGGTNTSIMLRLDGRVHTIQTDGLRLLNSGIGLQTKNTPALANNLAPRFFLGSSLEIENSYLQGADLQAGGEFSPAYFFQANSHTQDGVLLGADFYRFNPVSGTINSNSLTGLFVDGALETDVSGISVWNNSLVGSGVKPGIYLIGAGSFSMRGGLAGKNPAFAYTENQSYGIGLDASFTGVISIAGTILTGNVTGALFDNTVTGVGSSVTSSPGYNPRGVAILTVGASPYSYTAGLSNETLNLVGGTVSSVLVDGITIAVSTNVSISLPPRKTAVITYSVAPTITSSRQ